MRKQTQRIKYVSVDFVSAALSWLLFNVIRYHEIGMYVGFHSLSSYLSFPVIVKGQLLVPFFWLALHYLSGYYNRPLGKSRLDEFLVTLTTTFFGSLFLFFFIVLNDLPIHRFSFYHLSFHLFWLSFALTYIPRLIITQAATRNIQKRKWTTRVLIIGEKSKVKKLCSELEKPTRALSYSVEGVIEPRKAGNLLKEIEKNHISELIVAPEEGPEGESALLATLYSLYQYNLPIKMPLSNSRLLNGKVKVESISGGVPLVDLSSNNMSDAATNSKFVADKVVSLLALVVLSPLFAILALRIKADSKGSVFFQQERIGYMGKPFFIYKFRTMREDAEKNGPALSSVNDQRVTRAGQFMRKYRLDELPQFWNVLKGDMSLVGPRPERKFFIDQIVQKAPWFYLLHNTRPGITSWGMVKYGYAETVDEMIERLQYDIIYYENRSLLADVKVLIHTVRTVFLGKGV